MKVFLTQEAGAKASSRTAWKEVRSVGAGVLDLGFEFMAGGHDGFDPFDDGGLLGEGRQRKGHPLD
jgi:hypothetical protein